MPQCHNQRGEKKKILHVILRLHAAKSIKTKKKKLRGSSYLSRNALWTHCELQSKSNDTHLFHHMSKIKDLEKLGVKAC